MLESWLSKRAVPKIPAPISIAPTLEFAGNDGLWSTFPLNIGTPPQPVKVLVSTASSQTWVVDSQGCGQNDPANCSTSRGGLYRLSDSNTWHENENADGGLYPLVLEERLNVTGDSINGHYGYDTVALSGQGAGGPKLDQQVLATVANKEYYLGLLGLSPNPLALPETDTPIASLLSNLNESRSIPSLSWSYTAGASYRPGPVYGSLTLGGYDSSRFEPNDISHTFNDTNSPDLVVYIGGIELTTDEFITDIGSPDYSIPASIDSTVSNIILPENVCLEFEQSFGLIWDENVQGYLVNETLHTALLQQGTSVVFNIGNSSTIPGQGYNISLPYSAFDLTAQPPYLNNPGRYFPLRRASNESQFTLGRTFLQEAYVIANYEYKNFSVSQCTWDSSAEPHIVAIHPPGYNPSQGSDKLSPGAIAGIVIGIVGALLIMAVLGILFWRRRRRQDKTETPIQVNEKAVEIDSAEKDLYTRAPSDVFKGYPQSPELDSAVHKGHELPGSPTSEHGPMTDGQRFELDATERRSRVLSSPISFLSERSELGAHQRQPSDPISPTRERSDATRLHKRELSDPVSLLSERRDEGVGTL